MMANDNGSVVLMEQPETKVYTGETGYIVIKQTDWQDEEQTILIDPLHAKKICAAIMAQEELAKKSFELWKEEE